MRQRSDQMERIEKLAYKLKVGARLIFADKQPFRQHTSKQMVDRQIQQIESDEKFLYAFKQIGSCQCKTSWGTADIYIYEKAYINNSKTDI